MNSIEVKIRAKTEKRNSSDSQLAKENAENSINSLGSVVPKQLVEVTSKALCKLKEALKDDVNGYVAQRLHLNLQELGDCLATEQVEGVALAIYNIEKWMLSSFCPVSRLHTVTAKPTLSTPQKNGNNFLLPHYFYLNATWAPLYSIPLHTRFLSQSWRMGSDISRY